MTDVRTALLKVGATVLTLATTAGSALYVTAHLKNPGAPLRPSVLSASMGVSVGMPGGGSLTLTPSVRPSDLPPVTSTYAS
jgi:hypothetical protein